MIKFFLTQLKKLDEKILKTKRFQKYAAVTAVVIKPDTNQLLKLVK